MSSLVSEANNISFETRCCWNCVHLDKRTKFCRLNPPQPVVYIDEQGLSKVSSKFPVVTQVSLDWCSNFTNVNLILG